jgi:hypothetical protein
MKKIFAYILVNMFTWNPDKSLEIVREFMDDEMGSQKKSFTAVKKSHVNNPTSNPKSKKEEVLQSLEYLKSKQVKTKQDKESIYTLEMVLKSMG